MNALKEEMLKFIAKPLPQNFPVATRSIPVLFFGNIEKAVNATISINPSDREFLNSKGAPIQEKKKRFVDRQSLGLKDSDSLSAEQALDVYNSLLNYFSKIPLKGWFNPLNDVFSTMNNISYYEDSLIHLDITPWSTSKKWGDLSPAERETAIKAGENWGKRIIESGRIKYLFVNGITALNHVEEYITKLSLVKTLALDKSCEIRCGSIGSCKIIGWSNYVQRPITAGSKDSLKKEIALLL
jgi:hypothetical protein